MLSAGLIIKSKMDLIMIDLETELCFQSLIIEER